MRPILAGMIKDEKDLKNLIYPLMVSYKFDGCRALVIGGRVMSRHMKELRSPAVQKLFASLPEGTDGEIVWGEPADKNCFRSTMHQVMNSKGIGDKLTFLIFDNFTLPGGYAERYQAIQTWIEANRLVQVELIPHHTVNSAEELLAYEEKFLALGAEGIMISSLRGKYKFGRSSVNEGILLKFKRFEDGECKITGYFELEHNTNPAEKNFYGLTERGDSKAGKVAANALGGFDVVAVNGTFKGIEFGVGGGFTMKEREELWAVKDSLIGKTITVKYQVSGYEKPRFPQYRGFREVDADGEPLV